MALLGLSAFVAAFMVVSVRARQRYMMAMLLLILFSSLGYSILKENVQQQRETVAFEQEYESDTNSPEDRPAADMKPDTDEVNQWLEVLENPAIIIFGHAVPMERHELDRSTNYYADLVYNFGLIVVLPLLFLLSYTVFRFAVSEQKSPVLIGLFLIVLYQITVVGMTKFALKQPYSGIIIFFLWGVLLTMLQSGLKTEQGKRLES